MREVVAEEQAASFQLAAIADQKIPIMVADFMPEVAEQGSVWLAHFDAATFPLDLVGLRKGDRDDAVFMARHDFSCRCVGEKIKDQAVVRILGTRPER